jgi:hypothetical protein
MVDGGTLMTALVAALVLLVPTLVVIRMSAEERAARIEVVRAGLALRRARLSHAGLVRAANRNLRSVERRHSTSLAQLERRIATLEDPRGERIDSLGPVTLHALRIITPAGEVALDGVEATVDTAGALREHKRTTLTRLAVGGAVLGPLGAILALGFPKRRKVDERELYLLIEAGSASCVLQVDPDDGARVRAFATRVNAAAHAVEEPRSTRAQELAATRERLSEVREDHSALDAARERLAASHSDPDALDAIAEAEHDLAVATGRLVAAQGPAVQPGLQPRDPGGTRSG